MRRISCTTESSKLYYCNGACTLECRIAVIMCAALGPVACGPAASVAVRASMLSVIAETLPVIIIVTLYRGECRCMRSIVDGYSLKGERC